MGWMIWATPWIGLDIWYRLNKFGLSLDRRCFSRVLYAYRVKKGGVKIRKEKKRGVLRC